MLLRALSKSSHLRISASLSRLPSLSRPILHTAPVRQLYKQSSCYTDKNSHRYNERFATLIADLTHSKRDVIKKNETAELRIVINEFDKLVGAAEELSDDDKFFLFEKLGSDHVFNLIKEKYCLSSALFSLSLKKPLEFFEFLGADYMKKLKINGISYLLKKLEKDKQQFLDSLDAEQLKASMDSYSLKDVLEQIVMEERFRLLSRLGKDFLVKKVSCYDLRRYLPLLSEEDQKGLLNLMGAEGLIKAIKDSFNLPAVLEHLHQNNHQYLLNLLGSKHLKELIKSGSDLQDVIKKLNPVDHGKLLTSLDGNRLARINFYAGEIEEIKELLLFAEDIRYLEANTFTTYSPDRFGHGCGI